MYKVTSKDISKNYLSSLITPDAVIVDIGSYDGKDAAELAEVCNSVVHCLEPLNFELIKDRQDDRLIIFPYAIGCFNGNILMNKSTNHSQSSSLKTPKLHKKIFPEVIYDDKVMVKVTTLDDWWWSVFQGTTIDLIWCDINGSESDMILTGIQALKNTRYLYIEYCETELFSKSLNREQLQKCLPWFETIGDYNFKGNFGNLLMRNKKLYAASQTV